MPRHSTFCELYKTRATKVYNNIIVTIVIEKEGIEVQLANPYIFLLCHCSAVSSLLLSTLSAIFKFAKFAKFVGKRSFSADTAMCISQSVLPTIIIIPAM